MNDHTQRALNHVASLVPGLNPASIKERSGNGRVCVEFEAQHPKRVVTPGTFLRVGKKLGLNSVGIPSASNRNNPIVVYVHIDCTTEIIIKGNNSGTLTIEVRMPE